MDIADFTEPERQALMDLVVLAMYADGHLASAEDNQVRRLLGAMGVESTYDRSREFDAAVTRVRQHIPSAESARARALELAESFGTPEHQREVYQTLAELVSSDGKVTPQEDRFLASVKDILRG